MLEALDRNEIAENTLLIFSADNGTSRAANINKLQKKGHYPSGPLRGSKADLWDGGHRVPFLVRWPAKIAPNSKSEQLICLSDLMATFAALFEEPEFPDHVAEDSISFLPALYGAEIKDPREAIVHHSISGRFSIRKGPWKLLLASGSGGWSAPKDQQATAQGLPDTQLYNLAKDLGETTNLVADNPEKAAELLTLLKKYVADGRSTPGAPQKNDAKVDIWKKRTRSKRP